MKLLITSLILFISINTIAQSIPYDKKLHFFAGVLISGAAYPIIYDLTEDPTKALVLSNFLGFVAGIGKEALDERAYQGGDFKDFLATAIGSLSITIPMDILYRKSIKKKQKRKLKLM